MKPALIYALAAGLSAMWILELPSTGAAPGAEQLYPMVVAAVLAAGLSSLLLQKLQWLPHLQNVLLRGGVRGISVTLGAHALLGPLLVLGLSIVSRSTNAGLEELIAMSVLSLYFLPVTAAAGILAGIVVEKLQWQ